jgi:hypothetical protein
MVMHRPKIDGDSLQEDTEMERLETIEMCVMGDDREREYRVAAQWIADDVLPSGAQEYLSQVPCALLEPLHDGGHEQLVYLDPVHGWTSLGTGSIRGCAEGAAPSDERLERAA